jgi:hypothetical protein
MPGKRFVQLGKTKTMRLPEKIEPWIKKVARELDTKENPTEMMDLLLTMLEKSR